VRKCDCETKPFRKTPKSESIIDAKGVGSDGMHPSNGLFWFFHWLQRDLLHLWLLPPFGVLSQSPIFRVTRSCKYEPWSFCD